MRKNIYTLVAARIRQERKRAGLTMEQLAEAAGIGASFLAYIETEGRKPSLATIEKIAAALGIPVANLFKDAPAPAMTSEYKFAHQIASVIRDKTEAQKATILNTVKTLAKNLGKS